MTTTSGWKWGVLVAALPALAASDCDFPGTKPGDTGFDTTVTDSGATLCLGEVNTAAYGQYTEVVAHCLSGESSSGVTPPNFVEEVPASWGGYSAWPSWTSGPDPATGEFQLEITNSSGALLNNWGYDGTWWQYEFDADPSCGAYTNLEHDFYYIDGTTFTWVNPFAPDCPVGTAPAMAPPGRVLSGLQACVPGSATFEFAARRTLGSTGDEATLWLSPMSLHGVSFPERAWLRELEVVDWGDATNLHVWPTMTRVQHDGMELVGGATEIPKPASGPTVVTFAAYQRAMSSTMGIERLSLTGATHVLPTVELTWSCETSGQNPHALAPAGYTGYAATMPEISPIQHRLVFWRANSAAGVRIAPEGRYLDYVEADLTSSAQGGHTFVAPLTTYEGTLAGRLKSIGGQMWLLDAVATVGTQTVPLQNRVLAPL